MNDHALIIKSLRYLTVVCACGEWKYSDPYHTAADSDDDLLRLARTMFSRHTENAPPGFRERVRAVRHYQRGEA